MENLNKPLLLVCALQFIFLACSINANNQTYFACKTGFQFETNKNAARCIQQKRLTYRSPLACDQLGDKKAKFILAIDKIGQKDMCVTYPSITSQRLAKHRSIENGLKLTPDPTRQVNAGQRLSSFSPKCQNGFKLQARQGKDACGKANPELILPPSKEVRR